jgi:hypothetical protein
LSAAIGRSVWEICTVTLIRISAAAMRISERLIGTGVVRAINGVAMPPRVAAPKGERRDIHGCRRLRLSTLRHATITDGCLHLMASV